MKHVLAAAAALAIASAAACARSGGGSDSARDTPSMMDSARPAPATAALPDSAASTGVAATPSARPAPSTAGSAGAARTSSASGSHATTTTTSPATPGAHPPAGNGTAALVVFRDTILPSDLEWLRSEGFVVEQVNEGAHSVSGRMMHAFSKPPRSNPRVLRFSTMMR